MSVLALIGAKALYALFVWLGSAIVASYLSERKGYGQKPGLASGLLLVLVGVLIWLVAPARADSLWKREGPFRRRRADDRSPTGGGGAPAAGPAASGTGAGARRAS